MLIDSKTDQQPLTTSIAHTIETANASDSTHVTAVDLTMTSGRRALIIVTLIDRRHHRVSISERIPDLTIAFSQATPTDGFTKPNLLVVQTRTMVCSRQRNLRKLNTALRVMIPGVLYQIAMKLQDMDIVAMYDGLIIAIDPTG